MSNIADDVVADKNLVSISSSVEAARPDRVLSKSGPFIIRAATDIAFSKAGVGKTGEGTEKSPDTVVEIK